MTTVESKIKSIVEQMEGVTYIFENWATANVRLDSGVMPAILNVLPVSGHFNLGKMHLKDFPNCMLAFLDKADLDFDGAENDAIIERCKEFAKEFILRLNASGLFEQVEGDIPYSIVYDKLDVNVTGIVIEMQLKEAKGLVLCPGKDIGELVHGRKG